MIAEAVGTDEPVFIPKSALRHLSAEDIPEDVIVSVGDLIKGVIHKKGSNL